MVVFFNLYCAALFLLQPDRYAPAYELSGEIGEIVIMGFGILFLMWNVPYLFALVHPVRHHFSLIEASSMQFIAVIGESLVWLNLPDGHRVLESSLERFILFDTAGLILLVISVWLIFRSRKQIMKIIE